MTRSLQLLLIGFAALTVLSLCSLKFARAQVAASSAEVRIDNFTFNVPSITIPVGSEVTWVNRDDIPHTVVSEDQVFKSKALDTDDKFTYKFTKAGVYKYFCSLHPKMTAEVVVR